MDIKETLPNGNFQLSPIRITTFTRRGERAVVFAETERKYFGCHYSGDIYGWVVSEWYKPQGTYTKTGGASPLDLNLTQDGVEREAKQRKSKG